MTRASKQEDDATPVIVVSSDGHVGPRLEADLRQYCPKKYLAQFDEYAVAFRQSIGAAETATGGLDLSTGTDDVIAGVSSEAGMGAVRRLERNRNTPGHYDPHAYVRDMDWDGVAAEVVFHGSQNDEPIPFLGYRDFFVRYADIDFEMVAAGFRIYNRWLADFVSVAPDRIIGLVYVPMWDPDLAVAEVEWGAKHGLRGVNFPAPRTGIAEYDDPVWERLWAACADLGLTLTTHAGVPLNPSMGPQFMAITRLEIAGWPARRGMHRMILGGVFERHPNLHLVLTEQLRGWWGPAMRDMDNAYGVPTEALRRQVPKKPSAYMPTNVFIGASFMPPYEVDEAIVEGYASNVIWGTRLPPRRGDVSVPDVA